jgi:CMP-N-acetylneuraminic acid synthetase
MRYITVIPARGGSKGIPLKNIYPIAGKLLLKYTLDILGNFNDISDIVLSTDSDQIVSVAKKYSFVKVINRPQELATDTSSTEDTLIHAIEYMKTTFSQKYEAVLTLQPTSPFRSEETLRDFIAVYERNRLIYDAQLTLSADRTDFWRKDSVGIYSRLFPKAPRRRQDREPLYKENSCIYITSISSLYKTHSVLGEKTNGYLISEEEAIDINEMIDVNIAEAIIRYKNALKNV